VSFDGVGDWWRVCTYQGLGRCAWAWDLLQAASVYAATAGVLNLSRLNVDVNAARL